MCHVELWNPPSALHKSALERGDDDDAPSKDRNRSSVEERRTEKEQGDDAEDDAPSEDRKRSSVEERRTAEVQPGGADHLFRISSGRFAPDQIPCVSQDVTKFMVPGRTGQDMDAYLMEFDVSLNKAGPRMVMGSGFSGGLVPIL